MLQRRRSDHAVKRNPIRDAIAMHAYERFVDHGRQHGHDLDDWLAAEREFAWRQTQWLDQRSETPPLPSPMGEPTAADSHL